MNWNDVRLARIAGFGFLMCLQATLAAEVPRSSGPQLQRFYQQSTETNLTMASLFDDQKRPRKAANNATVDRNNADSSWAFYVDNDVFFSSDSDRDYTGGFSLTVSGPEASTHIFSADKLLSYTNDWFNVATTKNVLYGYEAGLTAFTPEDIDRPEALPQDRPYAGLVYVSNTRQYVRPLQGTSIISSLTLGVLGLDAVGSFQNKIHSVLDAKQAQGWGNQISNGGEMTFRYSVSKQRVHQSRYSRQGLNYEIKTSQKASLGYLTDVSWSISGRIGKLHAPWWSFNPETSEYAEKTAPLAAASMSPSHKEFYLWLGVSIHARAYNALLQGQFRDSAVTYHSNELNHLIGEAWLGVTKEICADVKLSYFVRGQTSEIKYGAGSRNPVWGGIIVSRSI